MSNRRMVLINILLLFIIFILPNYGQCSSMPELEKIAKNALIEEHNYFKDDTFVFKNIKVPFFNNIIVFGIQVVGSEDPPPVYFVGIDSKKDTFVFNDSMGVEDFNKFIIGNQKIIDKNNLTDFINMFLYLVDSRSKLISSYDDFDYLRDVFIEKKKKIGEITPIRFEVKDYEITTDFFSWSETSSLKKWHLIISRKGEIIDGNFKVLHVIPY